MLNLGCKMFHHCHPPPPSSYSIFILVVEVIGMTAVLPYAALNAVHTHPTGGPGLPPDDGLMEPDKKFHVRVLVPW